MLHRFQIYSALELSRTFSLARKQCVLCFALRHKSYLTLYYVTSLRDSLCLETFVHGFIMLLPRSLVSSLGCLLAKNDHLRENRPFYRYGGHIELIRFKEYYRMPRGHEHISLVFSSAFRDIFS